MKVLVVDDHALFREGLRLLLQSLDSRMSVVVTANVPEGAAAAAESVDLILMDWHLESELSGEQALHALREAAPHARIVVLSGEKNPSLIRSVVDRGAVGFIPKDISPERLLDALQVLAAGGIYLPPAVLSGIDSSPQEPPRGTLREITLAFPALTQRQGEVLCAALRGLPNKLIARELGISDGTVKTHLAVIFRELGVQSRTEAVYVAARHGVRIG